MKTTKPMAAVLALGLLVGSSIANADWVTIQQNYNLYGHLENAGANCAPTATANSFQYLQNRYGAEAGNLIPGAGTDLASARDKLINGWTNANGVVRAGMGDCGASQKSWWETKAQWIDDFGGPHVKVKGQVKTPNGGPNPFAGWYRGNLLQDIFPQWDFLWSELSHGEDIELGFVIEGGGKHAITLTSLKFDDTNGSGVWDNGEARKLDYLDPNNTSALIEADLTLLAAGAGSGALGFRWDNGSNVPANVYIDLAYTESVPEPGTLALIALALAVFTISRKRSVAARVR